MTTRQCGDCTLCCKLFDINRPEEGLVKAGNTWCKHCKPGKGCGIYETRPPVCVDFQCAWLCLDWLPYSLKPNECGAIFQDTGTPSGITCTVDNLDALHRADVQEVLKALARTQRFALAIYRGEIRYIYFVHEDYGTNVMKLLYAEYQSLKRRGRLRGLPHFRNEPDVPSTP